PRGAGGGRLVGRGEDPRGELPHPAAGRVAVLPEEDGAPLLVGDDDGRGAGVMHQLEVDRGPVRQRHALDAQVDDASPVDLPAHAPRLAADRREGKGAQRAPRSGREAARRRAASPGPQWFRSRNQISWFFTPFLLSKAKKRPRVLA